MTRRAYRKVFEIVRAVIHEWDPYRLLASGAPEDEFDAEIAAVVTQIARIKSERDAAHVLSRVFSSSFEPKLFGPEQCRKAGGLLYQALKQNKVIE